MLDMKKITILVDNIPLRVNSKNSKRKTYTSLVRPKLEHSSCVCDPHTKSQIHQLKIVQQEQLGTPAKYITIPAQLLKYYKHSIGQI